MIYIEIINYGLSLRVLRMYEWVYGWPLRTKPSGLYRHQGYLGLHMVGCQLGINMPIGGVVLEVHAKSSAESALVMLRFEASGVLPCLRSVGRRLGQGTVGHIGWHPLVHTSSSP